VRLALFIALLLFPSFAFSKSFYQLNIVKVFNRKRELRSSIRYYRVKPGDCLIKVMRKFGIPLKDMSRIARLNRLKNPDLIYAGSILKLPFSPIKRTIRVKLNKAEDYSPVLKGVGFKTISDGVILLGSGVIDLRKNPEVILNGRPFVVDLSNNLPNQQKNDLKALGIGVLNRKTFESVFTEKLLQSYASFSQNGTLTFGKKDILNYRYDYLVYDKNGLLKVINLEPDTPKLLSNLLLSYGVEVLQPKASVESGTPGTFKILTGSAFERISSIVGMLAGERGILTSDGLKFPKLKLFVTPDGMDIVENFRFKAKGFKVIVLSGNLRNDIERVIKSLPFASSYVNLRVVEPPGTNGTRSTLTVPGIYVITPKKSFLLHYHND
jgi:LysM repeat protein